MSKLFKKIIWLEETINKIILFVIIFLTFVAAMSRAFKFPLPWSLDLTLLLFAWFAFLAASQATRKNAHMGVDFLTSRLPKKIQEIIVVFNKTLIILFLLLIGYNGIILSIANFKRQISSLGISYTFVTMSVTVGCLLMMIEETILLYNQIQIIRGKSEVALFEEDTK